MTKNDCPTTLVFYLHRPSRIPGDYVCGHQSRIPFSRQLVHESRVTLIGEISQLHGWVAHTHLNIFMVNEKGRQDKLEFVFQTFQFLKTSKWLSSDGLQKHVVLNTGRFSGPTRSHFSFYVISDLISVDPFFHGVGMAAYLLRNIPNRNAGVVKPNQSPFFLQRQLHSWSSFSKHGFSTKYRYLLFFAFENAVN